MKRYIRVRSIALFGVIAAILTPMPAQGVTAPAQKEVVFSDPTISTSPISDRLIKLINEAAAGTEIRIALFNIGSGDTSTTTGETRDVVTALTAAEARLVKVRMILDSEFTGGSSATYINDLKTAGAEVVTCYQGCFGGHSDDNPYKDNNHNKFMLIDDAVWATDARIVVQTSANWNKTHFRSRYNDLLQVWNDTALYNAYSSYWDKLYGCRQGVTPASWCPATGSDSAVSPHYVTGNTGTRAYFFPRLSGDTIVSIIDNVSCSGSTSTTRSIRIMMGNWNEDVHGKAVADALARAKTRSNDCDIQLVVRYNDGIVDYLLGKGLTVYCHTQIHSKSLIVRDANYDAQGHHRIVWTGSHNYTDSALKHNDEALVRVLWKESETASYNSVNYNNVYVPFFNQFETIQDRSTKHTSSTPCT